MSERPNPLEIVGMLAIASLIFFLGRCSMDEKWEYACRDNRPVIIGKEVYSCQKK